jgi:hypothetical protein
MEHLFEDITGDPQGVEDVEAGLEALKDAYTVPEDYIKETDGPIGIMMPRMKTRFSITAEKKKDGIKRITISLDNDINIRPFKIYEKVNSVLKFLSENDVVTIYFPYMEQSALGGAMVLFNNIKNTRAKTVAVASKIIDAGTLLCILACDEINLPDIGTCCVFTPPKFGAIGSGLDVDTSLTAQKQTYAYQLNLLKDVGILSEADVTGMLEDNQHVYLPIDNLNALIMDAKAKLVEKKPLLNTVTLNTK